MCTVTVCNQWFRLLRPPITFYGFLDTVQFDCVGFMWYEIVDSLNLASNLNLAVSLQINMN